MTYIRIGGSSFSDEDILAFVQEDCDITDPSGRM